MIYLNKKSKGQNDMDFLRCVVERITYQNDDGYSVIKAKAKGFSGLVAVVGNLASVSVGSVLSLKGEWKNDAKYGRQFNAVKCEETLPSTVYGIEKYLGSGLIKGVGSLYAKKIVEKFGAETLRIIDESPDDLINVEGIGAKRVSAIKKAWIEHREIKNLMLFLTEHGVSTAHAAKIYKEYKEKSVEIIRENPYKLVDDIWGIGFKTADKIAEKLGFDKESFVRCRSGILYVLNELSKEGHCYSKRGNLTETAVEMLGIEECKISMTIDHIMKENEIICEKSEERFSSDALYIPPLYYSEVGVANRLCAIQFANTDKIDSEMLKNADSLIEKSQNSIRYSDVQKSAVKRALTSKISIITGGPGTGKTTTILGVIYLFKILNSKILLAAPTGRAAKRMSETCGLEAKTIHRLLGFKPPNGYEHNADNPIKGDVLIVDECSMVDIVLMNSLLKAVPDEMRIIFVGDADQLPPVGPGNVFSDIISSNMISTVKLETIFRQAMGGDIVKNAHRINKGEFPYLNNGKDSDFFFMEQEDNEKIPQIIAELCKKRLPKHYGVNPINDIQVLCPMNLSENGAKNLNDILQIALNPNAVFLKRGGVEYRLGDKVMHTKNNYQKGVFNGDIGIIKSVNIEDKTISVDFDNNIVEYDISELDELSLSYAITIHKSQGSEYPIVIIPFTMQFFVMLQKNLLYTGITRAKKVLILIGTKKAIEYAVKNSNVEERNTGLTKRIIDAFKKDL